MTANRRRKVDQVIDSLEIGPTGQQERGELQGVPRLTQEPVKLEAAEATEFDPIIGSIRQHTLLSVAPYRQNSSQLVGS
jgi:hypothetical protein